MMNAAIKQKKKGCKEGRAGVISATLPIRVTLEERLMAGLFLLKVGGVHPVV